MSYIGRDLIIEKYVEKYFKSSNIIYGRFTAEKKMFAFDETKEDAYFLTFDDDIIYPSNYSERIINGIERYKRQAAVGFHGIRFTSFPVTDYKEQKVMFQYFTDVLKDEATHTIGTALAGFYVGTLREKGFYFNSLNGSVNTLDGSFGKFCRDNRIKMVVLAHKANEIKIFPGTQDNASLWRVSKRTGNKNKLAYLQ